MNVTKIKATDMHQAIQSISREYGADAILLSTQRVRRKGIRYLFSKPYYEVTVGYEPSKMPRAIKKRGPSGPEEAVEDIRRPFRSELSGFPEPAPPRVAEKPGPSRRIPEIIRLADGLVFCRVAEQYANSISREVSELTTRDGADDTLKAFSLAIERRIREADLDNTGKRTVLFLGETGAGKTTSLLKLAARYTRNGQKVGVINTDAYRISACEQLKLYTDLLDIPLVTVYEADETAGALASLSDREVILIDTAGRRPGDPDQRKLVEGLTGLVNNLECLLVISARTSFSSCREMLDSFRFLENYYLLITKADETSLHGNILNLCCYSGRAIAYIASGQNISGDIEVADKKKIAGDILAESRMHRDTEMLRVI